MTVQTKQMNTKKTQISEAAAGSHAGSFIGDVKAEFKKISWTEPEELKTYTKVVVGAVFAFGFGIYLVDLVLQTAFHTIESLIKAVIG